MKYIKNNKLKNKIIKIFDKIKKKSKNKFNESIDIAINLNLNNKSNENIYGTILFPYSLNIKKKIVVFTNKSNFKIAYDSGAFFVGNNDLFNKIKNNEIKYDLVICTPDLINLVSKLGYILGPKGLMPNLKFNTITNNIKKTIFEFIKGKKIYKTDKYGIIHLSIGKINFSNKKLLCNFFYLIDLLLLHKFNYMKNISFIDKISLSSTMGNSYFINFN